MEATLPTGTVTFMFTDVEGSTVILEKIGDSAFRELIERHNRLIRDALAESNGVEVSTEGDSFFAVFTDAIDGVRAAVEIDRAIAHEDWGVAPPLVRIGLHTGHGVLGADNYVGVDVHRASRICDCAHGGQVVVSHVTAELIAERLPPGAKLVELGKYRLAGLSHPDLLHQVWADGLVEEFPPLRAPRAASHLPNPMTDFVGRELELETAVSALQENRLVTLTGPGGTGKTRLGIELARSLEAHFDDGAFFVPLATISDPELFPMAVIEALGLKTAGGVDPEDHLHRYLAERSVLLVLDNFEQLTSAATAVARLLRAAPHVKIVVTSRTPLRIGGEREIQVPPLDVPDPGDDLPRALDVAGVRLFASRAAAVRPGFEVDRSNVATISQITRSLDGLPLAIELAASRMRSLTPELILDRLGNQLLSSSSPDLPARQQTIINAIGWSYDLLDDDWKKLFEVMSVFSGTFGLTEAEAVCSVGIDVLDGLGELVEQSLLRQTETSGVPRYRMLTVIREFGYAALVARGSEKTVQDDHARVYLELAEKAGREILTATQGMWLRRLNLEQDNLRAAMDHAVASGDALTALRYVGAMWRFWQIEGQLDEGRRRAEDALAIPDDSHPMERARALTGFAGIVYWQGEWEKTLEPYDEALRLFEEHGSEVDVAEALYNKSFALAYAGDLDEAESDLRKSLEMAERSQRMIGVGRALWGLGNNAVYRDDWESVISYSAQAADYFSDLDAPFDLGWARFMVAHGHLKLQRPDEARRSLRLASDIFSGVRDISAMALIFDSVSALALMEDDYEHAAYFAGAASRIKTDTGVSIGEVDINRFPESVEFLSSLDEQNRAAYEEGLEMDLGDVILEARKVLDRGQW